MGAVWITSDWHFNHDRDFIYGPRGFESVYEMNKAILLRHNEVVAPEDDVYVLGDLMLGDNDLGLRLIKNLKGNIHVIRGNHDTDTRLDLYNQCYNIVEVTEGQFFKYNKYHFYLSHFPALVGNYDDNGLKKGYLGLCGHYHTTDPFIDWNKGKIFHCEVDTNNCYPWNIDTIIEKIKQKIKEKKNELF